MTHTDVLTDPPGNLSGEGAETVRRWVRAIDEFCESMRGANRSEKTIRQRRYQLALLAEDHLSRSPWRVSVDQLAAWLASYEWSDGTRFSYRATVKAFYAWAEETGRVQRSPAAKLPKIRRPDSIPRPTPESVVRAAFARATDRDRLMLMLALHAGLRRAEIASLRWDQIELTTMRITGKGKRTRLAIMTPQLHAELDAEHARRTTGQFGAGYYYGRRNGDSEYVFPGRFGGHLTPEVVGAVLSKLLGPGWTAHTLRHAFGTRFYQRSGDIRLTSKALGHRRLDTTAGYASVPSNAMRDVMVTLWDD